MAFIYNIQAQDPNRPTILNGMKVNHMIGFTFPFAELDFSECTDFAYMFYNDATMATTPTYNGVVKPKQAQYMFDGCSYLSTVTFPIDLTDSQTTPNNMFHNCQNLKEVRFVGDISKDIDFAQSGQLSQDTLNSVAFALLDGYAGTIRFANYGQVPTRIQNHVRLNQSQDGLEVCNAGDEGDLGTLTQYMTNKGWTVTT